MEYRDNKLELNDLVNGIYLKNQLLSLSVDDLLKKYQTEKMYGAFLDTIQVMRESDSGFFHFSSSSITKIEEIIGHQRFLYPDKDLLLVANDITCYFNQMKVRDLYYNNLIKEHYLDWHEEMRCLDFASEDDFLFMLCYDAVSYYKLLQNDFTDFLEVPFLSSVNYFLDFIPELFENDKMVNRAYEQIDCILSQKSFRKRNARSYAELTKNNFQKVRK